MTTAPVTLVITEVRGLAKALGSTRAETPVVLVTAGAPALTPSQARRVRAVKVRRPADVSERAEQELTASGAVLLLGTRARLSTGWEDGVLAAAQQLGGAVGTLGDSLLGPDGCSASAPRVPLVAVVGLTAEHAAAPPATPARTSAAAPSPGTTSLSAVLIVKDEEKVLGACLDALRGAVDEVVVYDTGSSDRTQEIARAAGALVVEGHWNDHFGDARNRAVAHASGDWVFSVDADEVLTGDAGALRRVIARAPQGLARVPILSTTWSGAADGEHSHPVRLFRRRDFTWVGALHEYLDGVPGTPVVTDAPTAQGVQLAHSGYQYLTFNDRDKPARNLAIAKAAVEALPNSGEDPTTAWDAYGRSLLVVGRHAEALEALANVLVHQGNSSAVLQAGRAALASMRQLRDYTGADAWIDALARHGDAPAALTAWRARVALAGGDTAAARALLETAARQPGVDRWGVPFNPIALEDLRAEVALADGRGQECLDVLLASLARDPDHVALAHLLTGAAAARADLAEVARRVPEEFVRRSAQEAVALPTEVGERWLSALHGARPDDLDVVVAATVVAARADLETAVKWSSVARARGLAAFCPLRGMGDDAARPAAARVAAWSLVAGVAHDDDGRERLAGLLAELSVEQLVEAVGPAAELVPAVVDVLAAAVDAALAAAPVPAPA